MNNDAVKQCIAFFCKTHEDTLKTKYLITYGKDQSLMKQIITAYGVNKTYQMIQTFFESLQTDKFLSQAGASVGIFKSQIPKLIIRINDKVEEHKTGRL